MRLKQIYAELRTLIRYYLGPSPKFILFSYGIGDEIHKKMQNSCNKIAIKELIKKKQRR